MLNCLQEPRHLVQLPVDMATLSESDKRERLAARKPQMVRQSSETIDDNFNLDEYSFMWSDGKSATSVEPQQKKAQESKQKPQEQKQKPKELPKSKELDKGVKAKSKETKNRPESGAAKATIEKDDKLSKKKMTGWCWQSFWPFWLLWTVRKWELWIVWRQFLWPPLNCVSIVLNLVD